MTRRPVSGGGAGEVEVEDMVGCLCGPEGVILWSWK